MSMWTRWLNRLKGVFQGNQRLAGKTAVRKRPRHRLGVEYLEARTLLSASVWLDKPDYVPGSTAIINGSGFQAGEVVQLQVVRTDGQTDYPGGNLPWQVKDGDTSFTTPYKDASGMWHYPDLDGQTDGKIQTTWFVESQYEGASLQLTTTGQTSGETAQATFTDGFGIAKLHLDNGNKKFDGNTTDPEDYVFTVGNTIVPEAGVDSGKFYDIVVTDSTGAARTLFARRQTSQFSTADNSYTIQPTDPASTATAYKFTLRQFNDATTTTVAKSSTKTFYVAKPTIYNSSALTTQQSSFGAGTTAFVKVAGLQPGKADWTTTWFLPSGTIAAANTGGGDRPDSNKSGVLAVGTSSTSAPLYLQYAPRPTNDGTDQWNWQSKYETKGTPNFQAFSSSNQGTWTLQLKKDNTHFVRLTVFTVDTTAPAAPTVTRPSAVVTINAPTYTISGVAEAGSVVKVWLDANNDGVKDSATPLNSAVANSAGTFSLTVPLAQDAANNFVVTATDTAGNESPTADVPTITEDSNAPPAPSVENPAGPVTVDANTYPISGHALDNSLVQVWVDANDNGFVDAGETVAGSKQLTGTGSSIVTYSISVTLTQNAANHFVVTASDASNNRSAEVDVPTITEDSAATAAPTVTNPASAVVVSSPGYVISGTAQANVLVQIFVDANNNNQKDPGEALAGWEQLTDGATTYFISVPLTQNAANNFVVTATNAAGTESSAADVPTITQSATAPTVTDPLTDTTVNADNYTIQGTAVAGSTVKIYRDLSEDGVLDANEPQVGSSQTVGSDGLFAISVPLTQGTATQDADNYFLVTASNTSEIGVVPIITEDSSTPNAPSTPALDAASDTGVSSTDNITADNTPVFTGTAEPGSMVTIYSDGVAVGSDVADDTGVWSFSTDTLGDGTHSITATASDAAGNTSAASPALSVTIDATPPTVNAGADQTVNEADFVTLSGSFTDTPSNNGTPTSNWHLVSSTNGQAIADGSGPDLTFTPNDDGTYTFRFTVTDAAGNVGSDDVVVTVNNVAPTISLSGADSVNEGATYTLTLGNVVDPGADTVTDYSINWGDGTTQNFSGSPNGEVHTHTYANGPNGYSIRVSLTDEDGTFTGGTQAVTVNNVAPTVTLSGPSTATAGDTKHYTFTVSDSGQDTFNVLLSASGTGLTVSNLTFDSHTGAGSFDVTFSDGPATSTISVQVQDSDGANGNVSSISVAVSKVGTTVNLGGTGSGNVTNDNTPTFSGTAEPGSTITIYVDGVAAGTGTAGTDGNWSITLTDPLDDGTYSITATVTDPAGNTSPPSDPFYLTIDTTAPSAPTLGLGIGGGITNDNTPTFSGTAEPGSTITIYVDGVAAGTGTAGTDGNWSITLTDPLDDGTHSITATVTDPAGNTSPPSAPFGLTVDTTAPSAPTLGLDLGSGITNDNTPSFTGTAEPGSTITLYVDGVAAGTGTAGTDGDWSITLTDPLDDGTHSITATVTDPAGNTSPSSDPLSLTVDATAPSAPTLGLGIGGGITNDNTPTFSGTAEPGSTITVYVDGVAAGTDTVDSDGTWSITVTDPLDDGSYSITATVTDPAGNTSPSSDPLTLAVDTTAPSAPTLDIGGGITNDNTPSFSGTAEPGSTVTLYVGGVAAGTATADAGGAWNFTVPSASALADATYSITATVTDPAGNTSPPSAPLTLTVDTTAPAAPPAPHLNGGTNNVTNDNTPSFSGTAEPGSTVTLFVDGVAVGTTTTNASGAWSFTVPSARALADGNHLIKVTATDLAGNTSPPSATLGVTINTQAPAPGGNGDTGNGTSTAASPLQLPPCVSLAFGPFGEVIVVVSSDGTLTQYDAAGAHVLAGGARSASVAFGPAGEVLLVTFQDGTLTQYDAAGAHVLGGGVLSASVAFGPAGEVLLATLQDGTLVQVDVAGVHVLGGGVLSASVAFGPVGEVLLATLQDGTVVQVDAAGVHVLGGGVREAAVAFGLGSEVLLVLFQDGTLIQFDALGSHPLGKVS